MHCWKWDRRLACLGMAWGLGFGFVHADVSIKTKVEDLVGKQTERNTVMTLSKDKLRLEMHGDQEMVIIYRGDKNLFWMIQSDKKTYTEMTSQDLENMAQTMDAARAKLQEQMKNLPEEQRQMMEKMMGKMMAPAEAPKLTMKKALGTGKVGHWSCQNWESYLDGVKNADHCIADFQSTGIVKDDFAILKDMTKFVGKLAPSYKSMLDQGFNLDQTGGIPVQTTVLEEGKPHLRMTIESIEKVSASGSSFDLPSGLSKKELPKMSLDSKRSP